ncbi:hypothetical protein BD414DRAFT_147985 [Trametes punicea]|nr:hypothetical protein BD414DRAFT_147985 [Trametes punicea]
MHATPTLESLPNQRKKKACKKGKKKKREQEKQGGRRAKRDVDAEPDLNERRERYPRAELTNGGAQRARRLREKNARTNSNQRPGRDNREGGERGGVCDTVRESGNKTAPPDVRTGTRVCTVLQASVLGREQGRERTVCRGKGGCEVYGVWCTDVWGVYGVVCARGLYATVRWGIFMVGVRLARKRGRRAREHDSQ